MSQVDRVHFFSSLVWVFIFFLFWYMFIISFYFPLYYRAFRGRFLLESKLWKNVNKNSYLLRILTNIFDLLSIKFIKHLILLNIVARFKSYNLHSTVYENNFDIVKWLITFLNTNNIKNLGSIKKIYKPWEFVASYTIFRKLNEITRKKFSNFFKSN